MYYIHMLARVYMHVLVHNRKTCVQDSSIGDLVTHSLTHSVSESVRSLLISATSEHYRAEQSRAE